MNADGTNPIQLTEKEENVMGSTDPSWSSDSAKIVFTKLFGEDGKAPAIAIMNADGTNQTVLIRNDAYLRSLLISDRCLQPRLVKTRPTATA